MTVFEVIEVIEQVLASWKDKLNKAGIVYSYRFEPNKGSVGRVELMGFRKGYPFLGTPILYSTGVENLDDTSFPPSNRHTLCSDIGYRMIILFYRLGVPIEDGSYCDSEGVIQLPG